MEISRERPQEKGANCWGYRLFAQISNTRHARESQDVRGGSGGGGVRFAGFVYGLYTKNHYLPPYATGYLRLTRHGVIIWGVGGVIRRR